MPETVIVNSEAPAPDAEESEPTWESVLSEVRTELRSGFDRLEATLREGMENRSSSERLVETMTQSNTALTGQITEMNQALVSRLDSLTRQPSEPVIVPVVVESQSSEEAAQEVVETASVETPPAATRPKRRLI